MAITAAQAAAATNSTPVTKEWAASLLAQQSQILPADGLVTVGSSISNATTNTALVTVPASVVAGGVAGSVFKLHAWGILSVPASAGATLAFHTYSGGSAGTALDSYIALTPLASLSANLWSVESYVSVVTSTTVQCIQIANVANSISTNSSALVYVAGNNSTTPVTVTASNTLTLNAVMGSAVSGSSFQALGGYFEQVS